MTAAPIEVFAALGDDTRQRLLGLLAEQDGASAARLAASLAVSRQAAEKQLRILVQADLVAVHRTGRRVHYSVETRALEQSARWLSDRAAAWDQQLLAIKRAAEHTP